MILPLVRGLRVEAYYADRGNWSFRVEDRDFEFLFAIRTMVGPIREANLQQLFRFRPALRKSADSHDRRLDDLRRASAAALDALGESPDFSRLAEGAIREDLKPYIAEHVVNALKDLPPDNVLHDLWNQRGGEFLALREKLKSVFGPQEEAGKLFDDAVHDLLSRLESAQATLADEHGLPPVDLSSASA